MRFFFFTLPVFILSLCRHREGLNVSRLSKGGRTGKVWEPLDEFKVNLSRVADQQL